MTPMFSEISPFWRVGIQISWQPCMNSAKYSTLSPNFFTLTVAPCKMCTFSPCAWVDLNSSKDSKGLLWWVFVCLFWFLLMHNFFLSRTFALKILLLEPWSLSSQHRDSWIFLEFLLFLHCLELPLGRKVEQSGSGPSFISFQVSQSYTAYCSSVQTVVSYVLCTFLAAYGERATLIAVIISYVRNRILLLSLYCFWTFLLKNGMLYVFFLFFSFPSLLLRFILLCNFFNSFILFQSFVIFFYDFILPLNFPFSFWWYLAASWSFCC